MPCGYVNVTVQRRPQPFNGPVEKPTISWWRHDGPDTREGRRRRFVHTLEQRMLDGRQSRGYNHLCEKD